MQKEIYQLTKNESLNNCLKNSDELSPDSYRGDLTEGNFSG